MEASVPSVDHSLWRYYRDGGKGFATRRAERMRPRPRLERHAERQKLARAAGTIERHDISAPRSSRHGKKRSDDDAAADRARQTLLGMILKSTDGAHSAIPIDEKMFKAQIETMPSETLQKMAAFFSTVHAAGDAAVPAGAAPMLQSLDAELAKRGVSLQLSGKVNNVYLAGTNSHWAVNASAGADSGADKEAKDDKGKSYRRYNNFGQVLGRFAKNFLNGH